MSEQNNEPWKTVWAVVTSIVIALIVTLDIRAAANSVFSTFSYLGSYFAVRHPWIVFGVIGTLGGHMALPHHSEPYFQITSSSSLNFVIIFGSYAILWEILRWFGIVNLLPNGAMAVNIALSIIIAYFVWPLRPSF